MQRLPLPAGVPNADQIQENATAINGQPQSLTVTPEQLQPAIDAGVLRGTKKGVATPAPPINKSDALPIAPEDMNGILGDALLSTPSTSHSAFLSAEQGFISPYIGVENIGQALLHERAPEDDPVRNSYDVINHILETSPGMGTKQKVLDWISNMAGTTLNPVTLLAGGVAGKAIGAGVGLVGDALPDAITSFLQKPLTQIAGERSFLPKVTEAGATRVMNIGEAAEAAAHNTGVVAASMIPAEAADNYNADTNTMNWGGLVKATAANGAIGFLLPALPYGVGTIWKKIMGAEVEAGESLPKAGDGIPPSSMPMFPPADMTGAESKVRADMLAEAKTPALTRLDNSLEEGRITPEEHSLFKQYLQHPEESEDLTKKLTQYLIKDGHPVDSSTNSVVMSLLKREDLNNLNGAISDRMGEEEMPAGARNALDDYMVQNRMDDLRTNNRNMIPGLQGVVDFMRNKLDNRDAQLKEVSRLTDQHFTKGISDAPISQSKLLQVLKTFKGDISKTRYTIPENVEKRERNERLIKEASRKLIDYDAKLKEARGKPLRSKLRSNINNAKQVIEKARKEMPEILSHKKELMQIRDRLISRDGLPDNFQMSRDYHRLLDLSESMPQARTLLDRVHLEHEYNKQEAYKDVLSSITNIMRSSLQKMADPTKVTKYLKNKMERIAPETPPAKPLGIAEPEHISSEAIKAEVPLEETPEQTETRQQKILKEQEEEVRESGADELGKEYDTANAKAQEFQKSAGVFKNLIACLSGSLL